MTDQRPLTDEELVAVARGENWRESTCRACGRTVTVVPDLTMVACHCPSLRPAVSVSVAPPAASSLEITQSPAGPTATERLVAEVRRLRSDEWLRAAILELAPDRAEGWSGFTTEEYLAEMLAIFHRHRDGKP